MTHDLIITWVIFVQIRFPIVKKIHQTKIRPRPTWTELDSFYIPCKEWSNTEAVHQKNLGICKNRPNNNNNLFHVAYCD